MVDDSPDEESGTFHSFANGLAIKNYSAPVSRPLRPAHKSSLDWKTPLRIARESQSFSELNALLSTRRTGPVTIFNKTRRRKQDEAKERDTLFDLQQGATWLAYRLVGGMRGDPFNALPDTRDCVPAAIDHLVQVFIPERILRPFGAVPEIETLAYDYFQLVIHDKCVFEATVAQAQASYVASQGIRRPTKEVLHHNGKALILLQEKLSDPVERFDDSTIHAILAIMGTHFFFMELDQHQAHLDGLWNLIGMRGGIETLGGRGTLRQAIETVTSFRAYHTKLETPASTPAIDTTTTVSTIRLDYPTHPFPISVTSIISKLPDGFCNVALKRTISLQLIDVIADIQEQTLLQRNSPQEVPSPFKNHIYEADKCIEILKSTTMPELERMICGGLLAFIVQSHISPALLASEPRTTVYDEPLQNIMLELSKYIYFNYEGEALLWVIFCFAPLQKHILRDYRGDFFYHNILRFKQSGRWSATKASLKKFLWTDARLSEWKSNWEEARTNHNASGGTPATTPGLTRDSKSPSVGFGSSRTPEMDVDSGIRS